MLGDGVFSIGDSVGAFLVLLASLSLVCAIHRISFFILYKELETRMSKSCPFWWKVGCKIILIGNVDGSFEVLLIDPDRKCFVTDPWLGECEKLYALWWLRLKELDGIDCTSSSSSHFFVLSHLGTDQ